MKKIRGSRTRPSKWQIGHVPSLKGVLSCAVSCCVMLCRAGLYVSQLLRVRGSQSFLQGRLRQRVAVANPWDKAWNTVYQSSQDLKILWNGAGTAQRMGKTGGLAGSLDPPCPQDTGTV